MNRRQVLRTIGAATIGAAVAWQAIARAAPHSLTLGERRLEFFRYLLKPQPGQALVLVHISGGDTNPGLIWTGRSTYDDLSKQGGPYKLRLILDEPAAAAALRNAPVWAVDDPYARAAHA